MFVRELYLQAIIDIKKYYFFILSNKKMHIFYVSSMYPIKVI